MMTAGQNDRREIVVTAGVARSTQGILGRAIMRRAYLLVGLAVLFPSQFSFTASAQAPAASDSIVTFTTQEDHRNMMEQLGITKLRPGPNGSDAAPNHANSDEALANPYPELPGPL